MVKPQDQAAARAATGKARLEHVEKKLRAYELKNRDKTYGDRQRDEAFIKLVHELSDASAAEVRSRHGIEKQSELAFVETIETALNDPMRSHTHIERIGWICRSCFFKEAARDSDDQLVCGRCGEKLNEAQVDQFESQFLTLTTYAPPARHRDIKVFDHKQLIEAAKQKATLTSDSGDRSRFGSTIDQLIKTEETRPLALPEPAWEGELEELAHTFPAFARVLSEVVSPSLAVLAAGGIVRPAPVLLVGPPGVGKTFFVTTLARVLGVAMVKQDMSTTSTGSSLSGLSTHWSNSSPGAVFKALAFGRPGSAPVANPLILLDELDKGGGDPRFDTFGPLHALLEEESSAQFEDDSLPGIFFDASHIRWIATANSTSGIPAPILSRMHVIEIAEPTACERAAMASRIFEGVVRSMQLFEFNDYLPDAVLETAAKISPREFKRHAQMAIGRALARGDVQAKPQDFQIAQTKTRKIGF